MYVHIDLGCRDCHRTIVDDPAANKAVIVSDTDQNFVVGYAKGSNIYFAVIDELTSNGRAIVDPGRALPQGVNARTPVGQIAVNITRAIEAGRDQITIRLQPAELGRVEVKLDMAGGSRVNATVTVERPETLELLQRDARALERALADAGLKTDHESLSFNLKGQGRDHRAHADGRPHTGANARPEDSDETESDVVATAVEISAPGGDRALDIRV